MTATLPRERPIVPVTRPEGGRRARLARLERPLLSAGLTLIAIHLLDLALSGPATSLPGVIAIVAIPVTWGLAQPQTSRVPPGFFLASPSGC